MPKSKVIVHFTPVSFPKPGSSVGCGVKTPRKKTPSVSRVNCKNCKRSGTFQSECYLLASGG
jgi:hypothetical protein